MAKHTVPPNPFPCLTPEEFTINGCRELADGDLDAVGHILGLLHASALVTAHALKYDGQDGPLNPEITNRALQGIAYLAALATFRLDAWLLSSIPDGRA